MTRVIIACAGPAKRWPASYLGVPAHLVPVDGEPLLHRTVQQARTITNDVWITAPPGDDQYRVPGAVTVARPSIDPSEYASTRSLWSASSRTILMLGDTYFTDHAIDQVRAHPRGYRVFGRAGASRVTGCPYGEIFAVSWTPAEHRVLDRALATVHAVRASRACTRPPGWMLLIEMQGHTPGLPPALAWSHRANPPRPPHFVPVDDLTDDFDWPPDYQRHPATSKGAPAWATS